jgi:hypothetical protein
MHVVAVFLILLTLICVFGFSRVFNAIAKMMVAIMVIGGFILLLVVIGSGH